MRTNRSGYMYTPAGSARALNQRPKPKKPKREINQRFLFLFFIVLPLLLLLSLFLQPFRWIFVGLALLSVLLMWLARAFLFPGRMMITAVYGLLSVIVLVSALSAKTAVRDPYSGIVSNVTAAPVETPVFASSYSTMGTDVPADFYETDTGLDETFSGVTEVQMQGGSTDELPGEAAATEPAPEGYVADVKSDAEIALENFMEKWRKGIIADMVEFTAPSWRNAQSDPPQQQLFWKFAQRILQDWRQMTAPSGTDSSTARTISVQADVNYGGELRTYQYDAITLYENGSWFVDPDSMSSGILVEKGTPTPDPNVTPTPTPEPTPTPTPGPKTKLYYNKDGGKKYHSTANCSSVASKYLPLKGTFTYKELSKSPYNKLKPCDVCDAPPRPSN